MAYIDSTEQNERLVLNELQSRWTKFMQYTNRKAKVIDDTFLREYTSFVSNVALRYGAISALANCPEIPNEVLGGIVRDYEKELVTWSGHLAGIERREADFLARLAKKREEGNCTSEGVGLATTTVVDCAPVEAPPAPQDEAAVASPEDEKFIAETFGDSDGSNPYSETHVDNPESTQAPASRGKRRKA